MQAEWGIDQCQLEVPEADQSLIEDTMFGCIADATAELAVCLAENECVLSNQRRWERCFESYASVRAECYYAAYGRGRAYTNWYNAWQRCAEGSFPGGRTCQEDVEQGQPSEATSSNLDDPVFEGVLANAGRNLTAPPSCIVAGYEDHLVHEPDVMHLWRAPETANYRFSSAGSEAFGLLWVSETCSGPQSACSGYPQALFTQTPSFTLSATAGTTYLVMFKGSVEGDAAYRIAIMRE